MLANIDGMFRPAEGKICWNKLPPSDRFHDLVDAAGVASRILWLFLGSGVAVVFLRTPRNVAWGASKSPISNWLTFSSASFLAFIKYLECTPLNKFITRMLCYWNSKNFWRKPPPTNGRGIHQTKDSTVKKPGESYEKATETFNCSTSTSLKRCVFVGSLFHQLSQFYFRKLLDAPKCLLPAEKNPTFTTAVLFSFFPAVNFSTLENAPCVTRLAGPVSPTSLDKARWSPLSESQLSEW